MRGRLLVSVVLSFRNERANIPTLVARLHTMFVAQEVDYELVFINDASTDGSLESLLRERDTNPRVKIINMARRCGVAECVLAGMAAASGDALVYMDADLQDPPELIPTLLAHWRAGAQVVHTVRTHRHGENRARMWFTRTAYRIIRLGSTIELPVDAGDFKLLSRAAVDRLLALHESDPYLRGLAVWLGSTQAFVPYERDRRYGGASHFPLFSKNPWKTFLVGLTSFSFMPIYACMALAVTGAIAAVLLLMAALALLVSRSTLAAGTALLGLITFFWATSIGAISAVGIYVIRIYKDVRRRPQFIVESTIGLPSPRGSTPESLSLRGEEGPPSLVVENGSDQLRRDRAEARPQRERAEAGRPEGVLPKVEIGQ